MSKRDCRLQAVGVRSELARTSESRRNAALFASSSRYSLQPTAYSLHKRQRGMSLVAAIFLIVIVAMLGAFAVRLGMGQHQTVNLALLSSRALAAANAGIEVAANKALVSSSCSSSTFTLAQGALAGFSVTVTCTPTVFGSEGTLYAMTSSAQYGSYGKPDFVSRMVTARFFKGSLP